MLFHAEQDMWLGKDFWGWEAVGWNWAISRWLVTALSCCPWTRVVGPRCCWMALARAPTLYSHIYLGTREPLGGKVSRDSNTLWASKRVKTSRKIWSCPISWIFIWYWCIFALLPWWLSGKESICQCRRHKLNLWVVNILWKRKWQSTPICLLGKSHGQRSLLDYSPWGHKRVRHDLAAKTRTTDIWFKLLC